VAHLRRSCLHALTSPAWLVVLLLLGVPDAAAAEGVRIVGRVEDRAGTVPSRAEIVARARHTAAEWHVTADAGGAFVLVLPGGGPWTIDARDGEGWRSSALIVDATTAQPLTLRLDRPVHEEQIVVTADNRPQPFAETGKAVTSVGADEIAARAEYSIADVLRVVPGVQVRVDGGPGQLTTLRLRGLRPDASAVLVDGLRFRDVTALQGDVATLLSGLHVIALDRVEVLRGAASSIHGTNAVGGAINVITDGGGALPGGDLQVEAGSLGHARTRGTYGGSFAGGRLRVNGGASHLVVADGVDGNDRHTASGLQAHAAIALAAATVVSVRGFGSRDELALNTSPSAFDIPLAGLPASGPISARPLSGEALARYRRGEPFAAGDATLVPGVDDPDDERRLRFWTGAVRLSHQRDRLGVEARYQRLHTARRFLTNPGGTGFQPLVGSESRYAGDADTADLLASVEIGRGWHAATGYEFERETYDGRQLAAGSLDTPALDVGTTIAQDAHAWLARGGFRSPRGLTLALSTRVQAFRLRTPSFRSVGVAPSYLDVPLEAPPTAVTGDLALTQALDGATRLRLHAGTAYRAPSLYERFGGGFGRDLTGIVRFTPYGDPRLEPDRYRSIDAGVDRDWLGGRLRTRTSAFYTHVVQVTEFDFSGAIDPATDPYGRFLGYVNGSGGLARGVETEAHVRAGGLSMRTAYTFTDARTDRDLGVPGYFRPFGVAQHAGALSATYLHGPVELVADLVARSGMAAALFTAGGSRAYAFPARATIDLGGAWTFGTGRRRIRVYAKVDNLLDRRDTELGWPLPGATVVAGLRVRY
jgi:iron complex outermembrane receptor protein